MFARSTKLWQRFRRAWHPRVKTKPLLMASGLGGCALTMAAMKSAVADTNTPKEEQVHAQDEPISNKLVPSRGEQMNRLKSDEEFDLLIIGGGATGTGIALDAALRGLSVALVERDDFASGTSGRSTKLIHGGVRYLEKAFKKLDYGQLELVKDALAERRHLINISPHLSRALPIIVPFYQSFPSILFYGPYYYIGVKMYDLFAGREGLLEPSYYCSRREAIEKFPMLKKDGLKGGMVYYDGQHNDARMNLAIALTAAARGAVVANHVEVEALCQNGDRVTGVAATDLLSGEQLQVKAKCVINATGPFSDTIRQMYKHDLKKIIAPSSGVHLVLSKRYTPADMGLVVPTSDNRVLFLLPWEDSTVAGTTDSSTEITALPRPHESEIQFILQEVSRFLNHDVKRRDVDAAWSGIRPLCFDPKKLSGGTAELSRDHIIEVTGPGLITIAGGKWTTYRRMAEDTVNRVLTECADVIDTKSVMPCSTSLYKLIGAHGWSLGMPTFIYRQGFDEDISEHLAHSYGDKAFEVVEIAKNENSSDRLAHGYPFIEAEVLYGIRNEMACTATDVIARRTRLAALNSDSAADALPRVIALMAKELGWDIQRKLTEFSQAALYIRTMNRKGRTKDIVKTTDRQKLTRMERRVRTLFDSTPLKEDQIEEINKNFSRVDSSGTGRIPLSQVYRVLSTSSCFKVDSSKTVQSNQDLPPKLQALVATLDKSYLEGQTEPYVEFEELLFRSAVQVMLGLN